MTLHNFTLPDLSEAVALFDRICSEAPAVPPTYRKGRVILYGAGNLGKMACDFLDYVGIQVICAYDKGAKPGDILGKNIPVYPPERAGDNKSDLILVTTLSVPFLEIYGFLAELGWEKVSPFYDYAMQFSDCHPLCNGWFSGPLTGEDMKNMKELLLSLGDNRSYAAYLQFLAWRVLREDWIFEDAPVEMGNRYFIDPVRKMLTDHEVFFDIGAHEGEVFSRFLDETGGTFSEAYLFEPDCVNYSNLQKNVHALSLNIQDKMHLYKKAVGNNDHSEFFGSAFGYASRLWDKGAQKVEVIRLDNCRAPVSFVKIHIEGNELAALEGGMSWLIKNRPIIAVTIYHNRDGLWKTGRLLKGMLTEYEIFCRMHSWCGTGMVIYMIPKRR